MILFCTSHSLYHQIRQLINLVPMPNRPDPEQQNEHTLLLAFFGIFLFGSPLTLLWASDNNPWFLPYLLWLLVILIGALLSRHYRHHDL